MLESKATITVGILTSSKEIAASVFRMLEKLAVCVHLDRLPSIEDLSTVDIIILFMQPPHIEEVRLLGRIRVTDPAKPILVVCEGLDVNHCVELLKYGVNEIMTRSGDTSLLWKKMQRAIHPNNAFAFVSPTLRPLTEPLEPLPQHRNRRVSFRASLMEFHTLYVVLLAHPTPLRMRVVNLSVPSGDGPGGMLLRNTEETLSIKLGTELGLVVEAGGKVLSGTCKVVRQFQEDGEQPAMVGVTYQMANLQHEAAIQKVWVELQRMSERYEKAFAAKEGSEMSAKLQLAPPREGRRHYSSR